MTDTLKPHFYVVTSIAQTDCGACGLRPANPIHLDARHLNPDPQIGQSRYKSIDHHLLAYQERADAADAENLRLRRGLALIEAWCRGAETISAAPLELHVRAVLDGDTD